MVGRLTLDQLIVVRIHGPQFTSLSLTFLNASKCYGLAGNADWMLQAVTYYTAAMVSWVLVHPAIPSQSSLVGQ